jgi:hypothetical protein
VEHVLFCFVRQRDGDARDKKHFPGAPHLVKTAEVPKAVLRGPERELDWSPSCSTDYVRMALDPIY